MISTKHKIYFLYCVLLLLLFPSFTILSKQSSDKLIWKGDSHAAFTALVQYQDNLYCAFRNANMHADISGKDCGVIKIIKSSNGEKWEDFLSFKEDGYDLRDPQLSVTPTGKMMLLTEKVKYENGKAVTRNSCVSFIKSNGEFTPLQNVNFDVCQNWNWIWNIEWIDGTAYGFCYAPYFGMVTTSDGINYKLVEKINLDGNPSEASVAKLDNNHLLAIVRRDIFAALGIYNLTNKQWQWKDCDEIIACPKIIKAKRNLLVAGRSYKYGLQTTLYRLNKNKQELVPIERISGDKDCSYPGIVYKNRKLFISYHKGDINVSNIYMVTINL